jgi:hypothetical protein
LDGSNKVKIASSKSLATGTWAPDNFHLFFMEEEPNKAFGAAADGSGIHQIPWNGGVTQNVLSSPDQKSIYINSFDQGASRGTIWRANLDGSNLEKITDGCGHAFDTAPGGQYLLTLILGENGGISEFSLADKKCTSLLPGVVTFGITMASDGKSFLYAVPSRSDVTIYRQLWHEGKLPAQLKSHSRFRLLFRCLRGAMPTIFRVTSRPSSTPAPAARPICIS